MTILSYLFDQYAKTKWPFTQSVKLFNLFGTEAKDELNNLYKQGYIKTRESNSRFPLIQLLVDQDGCEIKE